MARVLLINPNKWGRGITAIWIPAHAAALKRAGHEVLLFDATFYADWSVNEVQFNTANKQYRPTDYASYVTYSDEPVHEALQRTVDRFRPDVVFWSALSSHIHGEGEYVNIQYGYDLVSRVQTDALKVTGGLQATAVAAEVTRRLPGTDYFVAGESDLVLPEIAARVSEPDRIREVAGVFWANDHGGVDRAPRQPIIADLDDIGFYDYTVFDPRVFFRPYNGQVLRGVDYELSRGCIFTCSYCVETVVQRYYGSEEANARSGALLRPKSYLRHKSAERVMEELTFLNRELGVTLVRCQDTNFLTINRAMLKELADRMDASDLDVRLYIETRVDRMRGADIDLLKRLKVDGVGTGIELASAGFREDELNRFADTDRLVENMGRLRAAGIRRTTYNIIGLPGEDESMILDTIRFNRRLDPDNITVAFYSPYLGTPEATKGRDHAYFDDYEYHVDGQLRTLSKSSLVDAKTLEFYKAHFVDLMRNGLGELDALKQAYGLE